MIIAVDGPTASGKGTIARGLGKHYGLPVLDTGLLYRAVGMQARKMGLDPDDPVEAARATGFPDALLAEPELRSVACGALASRVSVHKRVRAALLERQRQFAAQPGGAILDGRDIGTVIVPDADVKLFVTASLDARAARRHAESTSRGESLTLEHVIDDLARRDERDRNRAEAPLVQAADAELIDNTDMSAAQALEAAIAIVDARMARHAAKGA